MRLWNLSFERLWVFHVLIFNLKKSLENVWYVEIECHPPTNLLTVPGKGICLLKPEPYNNPGCNPIITCILYMNMNKPNWDLIQVRLYHCSTCQLKHFYVQSMDYFLVLPNDCCEVVKIEESVIWCSCIPAFLHCWSYNNHDLTQTFCLLVL